MISPEMKLPLFQLPNSWLQKCWIYTVPIPWRSVSCVHAWLLKLAAALDGHHKTSKKQPSCDQRASGAVSHGAVRTLLRPVLHGFRKFFDFSCERAPMRCRWPVSIFRRVCVCASCTFRGSAPSAVQCASRDAEGDHSGDGAGTHREALLSRCFPRRTNGSCRGPDL